MKTFKVVVTGKEFEILSESSYQAILDARNKVTVVATEVKPVWRIGSVIKAIGSSSLLRDGAIGIVRGESYNRFAVEFADLIPSFEGGHDCSGLVSNGKGRWVSVGSSIGIHQNMSEFSLVIF